MMLVCVPISNIYMYVIFYSTVACNSRWSTWMNRDKPGVGDGDIEVMTPQELKQFCYNGKVTGVECITVDGIHSYSTGEIMTCSIEGGSSCLNDDNFPMPCSDYKIRYFCTCDGELNIKLLFCYLTVDSVTKYTSSVLLNKIYSILIKIKLPLTFSEKICW